MQVSLHQLHSLQIHEFGEHVKTESHIIFSDAEAATYKLLLGLLRLIAIFTNVTAGRCGGQ